MNQKDIPFKNPEEKKVSQDVKKRKKQQRARDFLEDDESLNELIPSKDLQKLYE